MCMLIKWWQTFDIIKCCILTLQESDQIFLDLSNICSNEFFLQHKYAMEVFYKEFTHQVLSVVIL